MSLKILNDIQKAELEAEEIIKKAKENAREAVAKAKTDGEALLAAAAKEAEDASKKALAAADVEIEQLTVRFEEKTASEREAVTKKAKTRLAAAADKIVEKVVN